MQAAAATKTSQPSPTQSAAPTTNARSKSLAGEGYDAQAAALVPGASPVTSPDPRAVVRGMLADGITNENEITNEVFWRANELLRGLKLSAGTLEALQWLGFRDEVVRPELAASKSKKDDKPKEPDKKPEAPAIDTPTPVDAPSMPCYGANPTASKSDVYLTQNNNSYDDGEAEWLGGSAAKNTCNMTALAMALISIAGSAAVAKTGVVQYLKKKGTRSGASAKIDGKRYSIDKILTSDSLLADVQLEDLLTAATVAMGDSYKSVTVANNILGIAKKTGLVKGGSTSGTKDYLSDPEVRQSTKEALERGTRIVAQTKGHYVYLVAVRDDGIIVHDPAGARMAVSGDKNLWPGTCESKLGTWMGRLCSEDKREAALRRTSQEPGNAALMERVVAASRLHGKARTAEKDAIKAEFPAYLPLGQNNFYALSELDQYKCRVGITLEPAEPADALTGEATGES